MTEGKTPSRRAIFLRRFRAAVQWPALVKTLKWDSPPAWVPQISLVTQGSLRPLSASRKPSQRRLWGSCSAPREAHNSAQDKRSDLRERWQKEACTLLTPLLHTERERKKPQAAEWQKAGGEDRRSSQQPPSCLLRLAHSPDSGSTLQGSAVIGQPLYLPGALTRTLAARHSEEHKSHLST